MSLLLSLALLLASSTSEVWIEAEDAQLIGAEIGDTREGFSGTGYVTGLDEPEDTLRFDFEAAEGLYEVRIAVAGSGAFAQYAAWIDGREVSGTFVRLSAAFTERSLGEQFLTGEQHRIAFQANVDVDYVRLVPTAYDPPVPPPPQLSDPEATAAARSLFAFLLDQYGQKVLSGQQELREVDYIRAAIGKEPAIAGGDLIEYSPSRWERGARPNKQSGYASVEDLIAWAQEEGPGEGIITLMWHWNAPTDLIDSASQPWWRGFYTEATTFNFADALAEPTSENYQLLLRDIDAIADQLRKFDEADIPVLWRPLHEAEGTWFWWGARGPEPFKELWQLLYDRLVNVHGLHHLIWVFTHENSVAWYPGDEFVDIVGRDIYTDDPTSTLRSYWTSLQQEFGGEKLVALSESGTLPDPGPSTAFGVWWSWFNIWTGGFIRDLDEEYVRHVYESEHVLTREELPNWRAYALDVEVEVPEVAPDLEIFPNPTPANAMIHSRITGTEEVRVEVFDLMGRRMRRWDLGTLPPGDLRHTVDLFGLAAGLYLVRLTAGDVSAGRTLILLP